MINIPGFRSWFPCHAPDLQQDPGVPLRFKSRVFCSVVVESRAGDEAGDISAKIDIEKATKTAEHVFGILGGSVVSGNDLPR